MKFLMLFWVLLGIGFSAQAQSIGLSSSRFVGETYELARDRHFSLRKLEWNARNNPDLMRTKSAERQKRPLQFVDLQTIPEISSLDELNRQFEYIRDTRFLETENPDFPRRFTWLFPDDGCYARAEAAKHALLAREVPVPKKLFVFGNLSAQTNNSPEGSVQWWYHVALAYRFNSDVYVFDPALEPQRPLKIQEWNNLVGGENTVVRYSVCHANTFDPMDNCDGSLAITKEQAIEEQKYFLQEEWDRLLELNRDPNKELGDFPPWKNL